MKNSLDCIPCLLGQAHKVAKLTNLEQSQHEALLKETLAYLYNTSFDVTTPAISAAIWEMATKKLNDPDPLKHIRTYYNSEMLKLEALWQDKIQIHGKEGLMLAIKLAIAGNIIDFGTPHQFDINVVQQRINSTLKDTLSVDDTQLLFDKLQSGKKLLYLGDNCGEVVFDKLLLKKLKKEFPHLDITFVTRGKPILNDIIKEDAYEVGIDEIANIIDNGDGAPSTLMETVSDEFKNYFNSADIIIAKGQGNFEGLFSYPNNNLFFLFMAKCNYIAEVTGAPLGGLLCKKNDIK